MWGSFRACRTRSDRPAPGPKPTLAGHGLGPENPLAIQVCSAFVRACRSATPAAATSVSPARRLTREYAIRIKHGPVDSPPPTAEPAQKRGFRTQPKGWEFAGSNFRLAVGPRRAASTVHVRSTVRCVDGQASLCRTPAPAHMRLRSRRPSTPKILVGKAASPRLSGRPSHRGHRAALGAYVPASRYPARSSRFVLKCKG